MSLIPIDGTWTLESTPLANMWNDIAYSSELGLFAAVAFVGGVDDTHQIITSPDGITWTAQATPIENNWCDIAWVDSLNLFVVVAFNGGADDTQQVMTSPDGINWTARATPAANNWNAIEFAPVLNLLVVIAAAQAITGSSTTSADTVHLAMTSPDGINWALQTTPVATNNWADVEWSPSLGLLVAVEVTGGADDTHQVMTSPDAITWTLQTTPAQNNWTSIVWSPQLSKFVSVASANSPWSSSGSSADTAHLAMTSPDGISWTLQATPLANQWYDVEWSHELSLFASVAITGGADDTQQVMTSPDGINWASVLTPAQNNWVDVVRVPNLNLFVAVGISAADSSHLVMVSKTVSLNSEVLGYRIGTSERQIGGVTADADGFVVLNTTTNNVFQASGGLWTSIGSFPAYLYDAWYATTTSVPVYSYRVGTSDRSGATNTPDGFIVINTTDNKVFKVVGGSWADVTGSFDPSTLVYLLAAWQAA